ncbi:MAG TPA: hypothetical protein VGE10_01765 [Zeimonas sp.]
MERFREPSTWAGFAALSAVLAAFGINIPGAVFALGPSLVDTLYQLLGAFGVFSAGAAVVMRDKPPAVPVEPPGPPRA